MFYILNTDIISTEAPIALFLPLPQETTLRHELFIPNCLALTTTTLLAAVQGLRALAAKR